MIGLFIMLLCMYRFVFTDWAITKNEIVVFVLAVLIELCIEALVGFGIMKAIKESAEPK